MSKNNILNNEEYFDVLNECGEFTNEIAKRRSFKYKMVY